MANSTTYDINNCKVLTCNLCDISLRRRNIVNGVGKLNSNMMIIGEAPGYVEDKEGIPFVGDSGQLLNELLKHCGIKRSDVYITNVTKCKPDNNKILPVQIHNCRPNLDIELKVINPKIVVLLGAVALNRYFNKTNLTVKEARGYTLNINDRYIIVTYHPAYVIRNSESESIEKTYIADFKRIAETYKEHINPFITIKL